MSLAVVDASLAARARVALLKAVFILCAALALWAFGAGWPDLLIAVALLLFLRSAWRVARAAWRELRAAG